jgi:ABC-type molybdenum transport system ATPase subunit/photorepair protein PhrA
MIQHYNDYLKRVVNGVKFEHDDFILVAHHPDEIPAKLQQLEDLLRQFRHDRGAPAAAMP